MTRGQRELAGLLSLLAMLQGCASYEGALNAAWLPPASTAAEGRTPGRVALMVPPQAQASVSAVGQLVKLQVGAIAEQAMRAALGDGLQGGVQQVYVALPPTGGHSATLVVDAVRFEHQERRLSRHTSPPGA